MESTLDHSRRDEYWSIAQLRDAIDHQYDFNESLLTAVQFTRHGLACELGFDCVQQHDSGRIVRATIELICVHSIEFTGALTDAMVKSPDRVNWGLTEIAAVKVSESSKGAIRIEVLWESDRRLIVQSEFATFHIDVKEPE